MKFLLGICFLFLSCMAAEGPKAISKKVKVEKMGEFDDVIWGIEFVNAKEMILTLRGGKLYLYNLETKKKTELDAPKVKQLGQGGLLDVALLKKDGKLYVYLTFSETRDDVEKGGVGTSVGRGILKDNKLVDFRTIYKTNAISDDNKHFGSRILFVDDHFFMTVGERGEREMAQSLSHENGKVLRLNLDGTIPNDNPYVGQKGALGSIWSYGHRNPQGIDKSPVNGKIYVSEYGPRGGDEINLIEPKKNYGWPEVTYGKEYWGPKIGVKHRKDVTEPIRYYVPSISPSGICFYTGDQFKDWKNNLIVTALGSQHLRRLVMNKEGVEVEKEYAYLEDFGERIRDVKTGKDGFLYFSTDSGKVFKITEVDVK